MFETKSPDWNRGHGTVERNPMSTGKARSMEQNRRMLFKIVNDGKEYIIYTNGEIEGYGDGAIVFNYFDLLVAEECIAHEHRLRQVRQSLEAAPHKQQDCSFQ
jgi:hypothetical protein